MRLLAWLRCLGTATVVVLALAACGSTATPTAKAPTSFTIKAVTKTVAGKKESVLVNGSGMTLYHYTKDSSGTVTCTGSCAKIWPPLTLPKGRSKTTGGSGVMGSFGTASNPAGGSAVVTYNGWPLYTYSGDKSSSEANGQGLLGVWFVATPNLKAAPSPSSSSGSGY
jgi:predicted lipoprotein with Yx(FWY)xxD motif